MNRLRCLHCGQIYPREEIWILPFIGQRCTACALMVLGFWQVNAQQWVEMIVRRAFPQRKRKEVIGP